MATQKERVKIVRHNPGGRAERLLGKGEECPDKKVESEGAIPSLHVCVAESIFCSHVQPPGAASAHSTELLSYTYKYVYDKASFTNDAQE